MLRSIFFIGGILLLYGLLFLTGCTKKPDETDLLLPVEYFSIPENIVLTNAHTSRVEVRIQASEQIMKQIKKKDIRYPADLYADLSFDPAGDFDSIEPGEYLIPVYKKRIPLGPGIKILNVRPSFLSVRLEKKVRKTLIIKVPYTGAPAQGYVALEAQAEPPSMVLTGPASLMDSIIELKTKPVDLSNIHEGFKKKIPLDLDDSSIVSLQDQVVTVTVPVEQQLVAKTIENIPIQVWNSGLQARVEPSAISISLKGPFEKVSNKDVLGRIFSYIDVKGIKPGIYKRQVYINIPVDLIMTDASPQMFTIIIK